MTMTYTHTVSLGDDIIDPRDIVARIEELDDEIDETEEDWQDIYESEILERATWRELLTEINDPEDGEPLILDSYFEAYAQQLAEDIGAIDRDASWPTNCINWAYAARELQHDYSCIEVGGYTYWVRS